MCSFLLPRYYAHMFRPKALLVVVSLVILSGAAYAAVYALSYKQRAAEQFRSLSATEAKAEIDAMIRNKGARAAWEFIKKTYVIDGTVRLGVSDPHSLAHDIGRGFFREFGINAIEKCDETFTGGCYHGVVEELVIEGKADARVVGELCALQRDPQSCAHGAGHGLHEFSTGTLRAMLAQCALFPLTLSTDCAEGVLMDDSWDWDNTTLESKPWDVCASVDRPYEIACSSAIGNYFSEFRLNNASSTRKYDVAFVSRVCDAAPTKDMQDKCFLRLVQSIARRSVVGPTIASQCEDVPDRRFGECLQIASDFSNQAVR